MRIVPSSQSPSAILVLFTLLLLALPSGVLLSPSLQPTAAFAQTPSSPSSSLAQEIIDETATSVQDSSSDVNILEDNNEFADEDAAIEQDNTEEQDAASIALQDEDATQEQDQEQDAANTNVDSDLQVGGQLPPPLGPIEPPTPEPSPPSPTDPPGEEPPGPPPPPPPPPEEGPVPYCIDYIQDLGPSGEVSGTQCELSREACEQRLDEYESREDITVVDGSCFVLEQCPSGADITVIEGRCYVIPR